MYQASGQSYTAVSKSMTVTSGESPKFAPLWIIDTSDAIDSRLTEPTNHNLSHTAVSLMTSLDTMLRTCNPLIQSHMSMGEKNAIRTTTRTIRKPNCVHCDHEDVI